MGNRKKKDKDKKKALKHRFAKPGAPTGASPADHVILHEPPGRVKMSEVIEEFIEPYSDHWETPEQLLRVLAVAAIAWNVAIEPHRGKELVDGALAALSPDARDDFRLILATLIERKLRFFADNTRLILDYRVTTLDDGSPHLSIMSTLPVGEV
jgi:hypothetical protein